MNGKKGGEKFALQINSAAVLVLEARQEAMESSCCGWEIILFAVTLVTTEQSVVILESILRLCCILPEEIRSINIDFPADLNYFLLRALQHKKRTIKFPQ